MEKELTLEEVKLYLENDPDGQKLIQSISDARVTKGIETWIENNLEKEVSKRIKELYPEEDPKDTEIKKLTLEIEGMKKQSIVTELTSEVIATATEKKLPIDIVKMLITDDKEINNTNIAALETTWNEALKQHIKNNVHSTTPNFSEPNSNQFNLDKFNQMSYQEKKTLKQNDPDLYQELTQ